MLGECLDDLPIRQFNLLLNPQGIHERQNCRPCVTQSALNQANARVDIRHDETGYSVRCQAVLEKEFELFHLLAVVQLGLCQSGQEVLADSPFVLAAERKDFAENVLNNLQGQMHGQAGKGLGPGPLQQGLLLGRRYYSLRGHVRIWNLVVLMLGVISLHVVAGLVLVRARTVFVSCLAGEQSIL